MAKTVKTFSPLSMARSLEEQSGKVGRLCYEVGVFLNMNPSAVGTDELRRVLRECSAAMWPQDDEG